MITMTADGAQSTLVDRGLESDSVEKIYINKIPLITKVKKSVLKILQINLITLV